MTQATPHQLHGAYVSKIQKIDAEELNATVIGLGIRLAFLGVILYLSLSIIRPFLETMVWSVVLAVALYPFFEQVAKWLGGRRGLAAALVTTLLLLIIFGPMTWLGLDLVEVPRMIRTRLDSGQLSVPPPIETVKNWPLIGEPIFQFWELASSNLSAALVKLAPHLKPIGGPLLGAAGSVGIAILQFLAAAVLAGFLLSPGPMLVETIAMSGAVMIIIALAGAMSWALTQSGFSRELVSVLTHLPGGAAGFMAVSILLFIVLGSALGRFVAGLADVDRTRGREIGVEPLVLVGRFLVGIRVGVTVGVTVAGRRLVADVDDLGRLLTARLLRGGHRGHDCTTCPHHPAAYGPVRRRSIADDR